MWSPKYKLTEEIIETKFRGAFSIAKANIANIPLTLISLYGLIERNGPTKGYAITNLHRMLSDLTCIFDGKLKGKRNIILGGDLNASLQIDERQGNNSHKIFFDRLENFGLKDCFKLTDKDFPVQTLRHHSSKVEWQNDYFFISENLADKLVNCDTIDNEKVRSYSDHNPVKIILDL